MSIKDILKKALSVLLAIFCLQTDAENVSHYLSYAHMFKPENDLINGYVLLNSGIVKGQRFRGPIHCHLVPDEVRHDMTFLHSFLDSSVDPMTDLIILLFPSAGCGFSAEGTGSFSKVNRTILIAGMLNLANLVRADGADVISKIKEIDGREEEEKTLIAKIFPGMKYSQEMTERYWRLIKDIVFAVGQEFEKIKNNTTDSSGSDRLCYPDFYTNYIILSYAWSVINPEEIVELAARIRLDEFISSLGKINSFGIIAEKLKVARIADFVRSLGVEELRKVIKNEEQLDDLKTVGFDKDELEDFLAVFDKENRKLISRKHSPTEMDGLLFSLAAEGLRTIAMHKEKANENEKNSTLRGKNEKLIADLRNFANDIRKAVIFEIKSGKFGIQALKFENFQKNVDEFREFIFQTKKIIKKIPGFSYIAKVEHDIEIDKLFQLAKKFQESEIDIQKLDRNLLLELLKDIILEKYPDISKIIGWNNKLNSSLLTQQIAKEKLKFKRLVPFFPGEQVLTHTQITTSRGTFADCAETAIRLLVITLLSKVNQTETVAKDDFSKNYGEMEEPAPLIIDLSNFPEDSPLRTIFYDGENSIVAASDGRYDTRVKWAKLLESFDNLEGIYSCDRYWGLSGNWDNNIKMLAALFKGYKGDQIIETEINNINTNKYSSEYLKMNYIKILNTFLKMRKDVSLEARESSEEITEIKPINCSDKDVIESNTIEFFSSHNHCNCEPIAKFYDTNPTTTVQLITDSFEWIKKLYESPEEAIQAYQLDEKNKLLMKSYWIQGYLLDDLKILNEIAPKQITDSRFVETYGHIIITTGGTSSLQDLLKLQGQSANVKENLKNLCRYIANYGADLELIFEAAKFLVAQGEKLEKTRELKDLSAPWDQFYGNCLWLDLILQRLFSTPEEAKRIDELSSERYKKCWNKYQQNPSNPEAERELKKEENCLYQSYIRVLLQGKEFKDTRSDFHMEPLSSAILKILMEHSQFPKKIADLQVDIIAKDENSPDLGGSSSTSFDDDERCSVLHFDTDNEISSVRTGRAIEKNEGPQIEEDSVIHHEINESIAFENPAKI